METKEFKYNGLTLNDDCSIAYDGSVSNIKFIATINYQSNGIGNSVDIKFDSLPKIDTSSIFYTDLGHWNNYWGKWSRTLAYVAFLNPLDARLAISWGVDYWGLFQHWSCGTSQWNSLATSVQFYKSQDFKTTTDHTIIEKNTFIVKFFNNYRVNDLNWGYNYDPAHPESDVRTLVGHYDSAGQITDIIDYTPHAQDAHYPDENWTFWAYNNYKARFAKWSEKGDWSTIHTCRLANGNVGDDWTNSWDSGDANYRGNGQFLDYSNNKFGLAADYWTDTTKY